MSTLWDTARRMRNRDVSNERRSIQIAGYSILPKRSVRTLYRNRKPFATRLLVTTEEPPFSMLEFSMALLSCNNKAPGLDRIKFNLLKNLPDSAKRRLLNLFNKFLELNIVPHDWREVKVIAIRKPGKPASDHNSYRPIAMLSCLRKLMEKMILLRLN